MEYNREEALKAREIAERKFLAKDIKGAKKFAIKAKKIYPELEGISQILMTLDVYISAEADKRHGESNFYGVLDATPLDDEETIRKKYRKLALLLHPDKNTSFGAEGAFQLVSQAWSMLSDKSKRTAYDQRRLSAIQQTKQNSKCGPPAPSQNGFHNIAKTNSEKNENPTSGPIPARKKKRPTFWTVCNRCKMQYEYLRMYLNHNLLCPNCHEAYFAAEIEPPSTKISKPPTGDPSAVRAAKMVHQAYQKVKRERQKSQAAARKEEALQRRNLSSKRKGVENIGTRKEKMKRAKCGSGKLSSSSFLERDNFLKCATRHDGACHDNIKCLLVKKARGEIQKKLNEAARVKDSFTCGSMCNPSKLCESEEKENKLNSESLGAAYQDSKLVERMSVDVPSSDFHGFDQDRREECFSENQVWGVYDDHDGMPRHYAMIQKVISVNPFKVQVNWLRPVAHVSCWLLSGFSRTCGEFGIGRVEICESVEWFSHKVRMRWMKQSRSRVIEIFPRKGDVWALYRDWSHEWSELTRDKVMRKYDMVEVLEDYEEEVGVIVIPLVKVGGFKSVFHQSLSPREIRRIHKEEMSRFSHQVPCHLLHAGEGSRELDPAAVPMQFLEIMSNVEEIEFMGSDEEVSF